MLFSLFVLQAPGAFYYSPGGKSDRQTGSFFRKITVELGVMYYFFITFSQKYTFLSFLRLRAHIFNLRAAPGVSGLLRAAPGAF